MCCARAALDRQANIYHVSSADVLDDLIVISLRNTNAIVALHVNGSGVAWVVASPGALAGANATSRTLALGGARAAAGACSSSTTAARAVAAKATTTGARRAIDRSRDCVA